jgi:SecD/SecF fusion protein
MKAFRWRLTICLVPLLLSAAIVGLAFRSYFAGQGGFKLGVDLVGGTILVYEVDLDKLPGGKLPDRWDPQELARRLKNRIDPTDLYNITVRVANNTRFEIILPTGGQRQIEAQEQQWRKLLNDVELNYPVEAYKVPPGQKEELLADINAQTPADAKDQKWDIAEIKRFIAENYKAPDDKPDEKAWLNLLAKAAKEYPPEGYVIGRGRIPELTNAIEQQYPDKPAKEIAELLKHDSGTGSGEKSKRGVSLTPEQVQERKELIASQGSLEFRMLANRSNDGEAINAARAWFDKAAKDPSIQRELENLAFADKPPPPPTAPGGGTTFNTDLGTFAYSWVELGADYRREHGLANPRDEKGNLLVRDSKGTLIDPKDVQVPAKREYSFWSAAAAARKDGRLFDLPTGAADPVLVYSRAIPDGARLSEKDRDKCYEYFALTRDAEDPTKKVTGDYLAAAGPGDNGDVNFRFKPAGAELFGDFTGKNKSHLMAIVLDGLIESAATINDRITTNGRITGNFTPEKIDHTVRVLRSGSLQATLKREPVSESTMGPTLGAETVRSGAISVGLAFAAVLLFMLFYYRFAGLVACVALMANLLMTVAFMVVIDATFTLPGLAGLVLMLGMAVDANVLIYERLREERERGANLALAIRNGYEHALPTIIDTHLSSIFTAVVLYVVGNDQLKGFGISLTVGLIISLFTSLYMTRFLFDFWLANGWLHKLSMLQLFHRPNIDFMRIRYYWFTATIMLTILGAALFVYRMPDPAAQQKKSVLNIDFVGGTAYGGELTEKVDADKLRHVLAESNLPDLSVEQIFLSSSKFTDGSMSKLFTLRTSERRVNVVQDEINNLLGDNGPDPKVRLKRIDLSAYHIYPGGREVTLAFTDPVTGKPDFASRAQVSMQLAKELKAQGLEAAAQSFDLQGLGREEEGHFQWMKLVLTEPVKDTSKLAAALQATATEFKERPQPERLDVFDSQLAAETKLIALYAILASWAAILLYLWFRFGSWTFGAATVLCLIHDLFFTLGIIAACHYISGSAFGNLLAIRDFKIDLPTVAALLTLVGYSVNDTIVVFDRIREVRGKNPALTPQMINDSVNQTLSRTVLASLTVWVVVIVLYIWGGEGVHLFAFVMIVGVIVGTYSSIYIASPLLLIFGEGRTATAANRAPRGLQPAGQRG